MKTRQKPSGPPEPDAPWSEILPRLWMGGHSFAAGDGGIRPAVVGTEFDLVISLWTRDGHGPHPRVEHLVHELPDAPLTGDQIHAVQRLAATAADAVRADRTVLVRCHSGYNRSGLVAAQTLIALGHPADAAIALIRRKRSAWALHNPVFESYLITGLDTARLLVGLEPAD